MSRDQPRDDYGGWSQQQRMHPGGAPPNMNHRFPPSHNEYMPHQRMPHQEHGFAPGSFGGHGNGYQMNMGAGMGMGGYGTAANHPGLNPYQVQDYYSAPSATSPTGPNVPHGYPGPGPYAPRPVPHGHPDSGYGPPGAGMMSPPPPNFAMRSTLWMGNLEPWMDEDYVRQACSMFSWHPTEIRVPRPTEGEAGQPLPNNTGYCFISFATASEAAAALARVTAVGPPPMMPNSQRPFNVDWADCVPTSTLAHHQSIASSAASSAAPKTQPEYSIFVGDLAPEATNSDLVAVFRNPILGLREDRRPKHVHPFHSCKSAKIMLDPVTGVSKGYGFVRFTDEADQQRALVEMHGLYCLSRPMRISPATAKNRAVGVPGVTSSSSGSSSVGSVGPSRGSSTVTSPGLPMGPNRPAGMVPQRPSPKPTPPPVMTSVTAPMAQVHGAHGEVLPEAMRAQAQQRNLYENIIGPNGEQLTSSDPYNTTVFVGGLSPLIGEETLKSFFAPFGEIHYVKVPVGKHCGFVQFVRKSDAERAIEAMNGYPIGGSRIRLSWGRSQFKAVQAAAQQARANSLVNYFQAQDEARVQAQTRVPQVPTGAGPAATAQRMQWHGRPISPPPVAERSGRSLSPREAADIAAMLRGKGIEVQDGNVTDALRRFLGDSPGSTTPSSLRDEADAYARDLRQGQFSPDPMPQGRGPASFQNSVIQRPLAPAPDGARETAANASLASTIWAHGNRTPRTEDHDIQDLNGTLASLGIDPSDRT